MATLFKEGDISYMQLTKDRLSEAVKVARNSFFIDETICKAIDLKSNPKAADELEELFWKAGIDGLSLVAFDKANNKIAGVIFNKLHVKGEADADYYQNYSNRCKELASKAFLTFMRETDLFLDLFEHCQTDCYLEMMFLGVLAEYRGRSIANNLCKATELTANVLYSGINMKFSINEESKLSVEPRPKYISAIFTSAVSKKLGPKLGMSIAGSVSLNLWKYNGETFAERLGNENAEVEYHYKKLSLDEDSSNIL